MNQRFLRYLTTVATFATLSLLAISASAQYEIKRMENTQGTALVNHVPKSPNGIYIVQMIDEPVVAYKGGIKGLKATKPNKGKKIDPDSKAVVKYVAHQNAKHAKALSKVGGEKVYDYNYSFNGFAARMSHEQAKQLQKAGGVVAVSADERRTLDTVTTPDFLELTAPGGLWDIGVKGEDVIIGIVDGGIWPESPSFSDQLDYSDPPGSSSKRNLAYGPPPAHWTGSCQSGEGWSQDDCNNKIIGARYYNTGFGGNSGIASTMHFEYLSPRDWGGHGSHTASTAGGNNGTPLTGDAAFFGTASGIAPRARIAAYKVCWGDDGCFGSDSVAAIDQAVADGVDVINYSISGSRTNFMDAVEVAFLFAADAGVFVAASAGNSGPDESTVAHPGPWLTTVANSTHDRNYDGDVTLGNLDVYSGSSVNTTGAGPTDLVYSADVGLGGADAEEVRLCYPGTLDPALITGKIVLCDRGAIARVDKSLAVFMAGGVGSILANPNAGQSQNADFHSVPTVHVDNVSGDAIRDYIAAESSPTAEISASYFAPVLAPFIAGGSSRGPLLAGGGDLLKPDVSGPGTNVLAAVAPPGNGGQDFALYSGTSMSSPHIAGIGALMKELHPDWSPMAIKSALMTTGYDLLSGPDPFAQGAGHVDPNSAADPGLVYDHGFFDWLAFLCGTTDGVGADTCSFLKGIGFSLVPTDMNVASVSIGDLAGTKVVTRTVTNVSDEPETYEFSYSLPGIDVVADPAVFTIAPGASKTFTLAITPDGATPDTYATGFFWWIGDKDHVVRSPILAKPILFASPGQVGGSGTDGGTSFDVLFGYDGDYTAAAHGLEPATMTAGNVEDDPTNDFDTAWGTCDSSDYPNSLFDCTGITWHVVTVPAGTGYTRISLFDEYTDGNDDLDLNVYDSGFVFVGGSGSGTSAEQVDILLPADTTYNVAVHGWQTDGPDANYTLFDWSVSATPGGNMSVDSAPASALAGTTGTVDVSWSGVPSGKQLGAVSHSDGGGIIDLTLVSVEVD
jgi:subtilisin family serine protease